MQQSFHQFLDSILTDCQSLYILGDLFDYWVYESNIPSEYQDALNHLKQLSEKGIKVYFMSGNRDFLITKKTLDAYGITALLEPSFITIDNKERICLVHGDSLCTSDIGYQLYKKCIRAPVILNAIKAMSDKNRLLLARFLRAISKGVNTVFHASTPSAISERAIKKLYSQEAFSLLIHGHIHAPGVHSLTINNTPVQRVVLGDWGNSYNVVRIAGNTCTRFSWI